MIKLKRVLAATAAALLVVTSCPVVPSITVHAAITSSDNSKREEFIEDLFNNSSYGEYLIRVQPYGCLKLPMNGDIVEVTHDSLSVNYGFSDMDIKHGPLGGVIDLPRLTAEYYYDLSGANSLGFSVERTLYPSLSWSGDIKEDLAPSIILQIKRHSDEKEVYQCTVQFSNEQFFGIEHNDAQFVDVSDDLLRKVQETDGTRYNINWQNHKMLCYPVELHKGCIITSYFVIGNESFKPLSQALTAGVFDITDTVKDWEPEPIVYDYTDSGRSGTIDLKKHLACEYTNKPAQRSDFFAVFAQTATYKKGDTRGSGYSTTDGAVVYNSNKGIVSTPMTVKKVYDSYTTNIAGMYMYCLGDKIELYQVNAPAYVGDLNAVGNEDKKVVNNGVEYTTSGIFGRRDVYHWFVDHLNLFMINGKEISKKEEYPEALAIDKFTYKSPDHNELSVYYTAAAYNGIVPHAMAIDAKAPEVYYTLVTRYKDPTDATKPSVLDQEYQVPINGDISSMRIKEPSEYFEYYAFAGWFTDEECTQAATLKGTTEKATEGETITWYGKYDYVGGEYDVTFYNDATKQSTSQTVETRYQPEIPKVTDQNGYLFKNWQIVDTIASTSGTPYDPDTFKPKKNRKYTFKTFWDVNGVITSIEPLKDTYYVGEDIDKSKVVVTVQTDNNGNTRTLNTDEYTVSPATLTTTGTNQITVTYTATGATGTFNVAARDAVPTSLTARYMGGNLDVGKSIDKANISVSLNYTNGKTEPLTTSQFTISPSSIASAGNNTIRVTYGSLSTTVTITGNKVNNTPSSGNSGSSGTQRPSSSTAQRPSSSNSNNNNTSSNNSSATNNSNRNPSNTSQRRELQSIRATYKGDSVQVGDILRASDIEVEAHYTDGSSNQISSTAFQFSPSYVRAEGDNEVTVTYSGKQTTFSVNAVKAESSSTEESSSAALGNTSSTSGSTTGTNANNEIIRSVNEKTGAGRPAQQTGTSKYYIGGFNVLSNELYSGSNPDSELINDIDIMEQLELIEPVATKTTVTLYNGASGNDITTEVLDKVKELGIQLDIAMLDVESGDTLGVWTLDGSNLGNDEPGFNPNIEFEVLEKGPEILTHISVDDTAYPSNTRLSTYPNVHTYESGETISIYSCDSNKENAKQETTFAWTDLSNPVRFNLGSTTDYCLTNTTVPYAEGSSLMGEAGGTNSAEGIIDNPEMGTDIEPTTESEETEESFDWGEELGSEEQTEMPSKPGNKKSKGSLPIIIGASVGGVIFVAGIGTVTFMLLRNRRRPTVVPPDVDVDMEPDVPDDLDEDISEDTELGDIDDVDDNEEGDVSE